MKKHCGFKTIFKYLCIPLGPIFLVFLPFLEKLIAFRKSPASFKTSQ